jgi:hypothetical protein
VEKFTNVLSSSGIIATLAAPCTSDDETITVTVVDSDALDRLEGGEFRIRIGNELCLVTARDGTTWSLDRGTEGTSATSHASGSGIKHPLTAESLRAYVDEHAGSGSGSADSITVDPAVNGQDNVQDALEDLDSRITEGGGTIVSNDGTPLGTLDLVEDAEAIRTAIGTIADDDERLADARTPIDGSVTNAKVASDAAIAESKLNLASDASANVASRRTLGTGAQQAAAGNHTHTGLSVQDAGTPSVRALGTNSTEAAAGNHTHSTLPSSDEKAALAGSEGTPGASNPYVTGSDPRLIVTHLWSSDEDDYVPIGGVSAVGDQVRQFVGPVDPADRSWTLADGDTWDQTE